MSFSTRLRKAMADKSISQAELSILTEIGKSSISQYMSGKNEPRETALSKIADAINCSIAFLKGEIEYDTPLIPTGLRNLSVKQAAELLDKSPQFVRVSLQQGVAPYGFAVKTSSKWTYHISAKKLQEYIGV